MGFSRSNIEELIIKPPSWSVCRQLLYGVQTVSSAASHKDRMFLVLEIQTCLVPVSGVGIQSELPPCKHAHILPEQIVQYFRYNKKVYIFKDLLIKLYHFVHVLSNRVYIVFEKKQV